MQTSPSPALMRGKVSVGRRTIGGFSALCLAAMILRFSAADIKVHSR